MHCLGRFQALMILAAVLLYVCVSRLGAWCFGLVVCGDMTRVLCTQQANGLWRAVQGVIAKAAGHLWQASGLSNFVPTWLP